MVDGWNNKRAFGVVAFILLATLLSACGSAATQRRIDDLENQLSKLSRSYVRLAALVEKNGQKIALLYDKPAADEKVVAVQDDGGINRPPEHLTVVKLTPETKQDEPDSSIIVPPPVGIRPQKLLKEAEAYYDSREFDDAEVKYLKFLNYFPKHSKAAQALFRLGEIHFNGADYQGAVQFYNDAIERFPQNEIIPDVFLQLASAQQNMQQNSEAIETLRELINSYPDTIATKKARVRLMPLAVTEE